MSQTTLFQHLDFSPKGEIHYNLSPSELIQHTLDKGQGELADNEALVVKTGEFTGRSPKDKFVVKDANTEDKVWWGPVNNPFPEAHFGPLMERVLEFLEDKPLYVRDAFAGADPKYRLKVRVINQHPWQNLFVNNLFIRPTEEELNNFEPDWTVIAAPEFKAEAGRDGTRQHNFSIINFTKKVILIGGSAYTGEIKKGIFSVMNYLLPLQEVLSMHCSANIGPENDTALFFGLSGTGKTTLSADPNRKLIGDDEHGWTEDGVFNFEGGCYAKCINLSAEKEPQIWAAIQHGALVENTTFKSGSKTIDFDSKEITENTRVAYPIHFIPNAEEPSVGPKPKNIFLLTADASGVLPPISRLTTAQAMYHFISGYTSKLAGTEAGVVDPQATFSACFGQAFLPLHPAKYAELLGRKLDENPEIRTWLVNTGWTGGKFGVGERMSLKHTRAMITAALKGELDDVDTQEEPFFGLFIPVSVPNVPDEVLNPRNTWPNPEEYDQEARALTHKFNENFAKYREFCSDAIISAAPKVQQ